MIPNGNNSIPVIFFFCIFLFISCPLVSAVAEDLPVADPLNHPLNHPGYSENHLFFLNWEGSILSRENNGVAVWATDSAGNLRSEIMMDSSSAFSSDLNNILNWAGGEGWTLISVASGGGTFSRWFEEWQELPPYLDIWQRVIISQIGGGLNLPAQVREITPEGRVLQLPLFNESKDQAIFKRFQLPQWNQKMDSTLKNGPKIRKILTRRGHGRGGMETVINLTRASDGPSETRITSSRFPGSIRLGPVQPVKTEIFNDEVFLPWWPLSEIIRLK